MLPIETTSAPAPLLLRPVEAAKLLGISPRHLWDLTKRREIPVIKIGRNVRIDPADLRQFIQSRKAAL